MPLLTRGPAPIVYTPIGVIHTPFLARKDTPGQGVFSDGARGRVELFEAFRDGLADIDAFSHLVLLFHLDRADGYSLSTIPMIDDRPRGVFATRHYNRPNPIGFSIVRLDRVVGTVLEVSDVDMLDKTPLLDLKPYVSHFDRREAVRNGWYDEPGIDFTRARAGHHRG